MAAAKKSKTARGRKQDRARVAGGQDYEVQYEAKKTGKSAPAVKKAVKKVGNARKRVEKRHVVNRGLRGLTGDVCWRVSTGNIEGSLSCMRIGAVLHPTMLFAFADGARFLEHVDRPTLQCPYRRPSLTGHQH